jgi:hypothetical protein
VRNVAPTTNEKRRPNVPRLDTLVDTTKMPAASSHTEVDAVCEVPGGNEVRGEE